VVDGLIWSLNQNILAPQRFEDYFGTIEQLKTMQRLRNWIGLPVVF
jgi:hypothetical protein